MHRRLSKFVLVSILVVLTLVLGAQIVLRYVFNIGLIWADEVSRILFVWVSFLGLMMAYEKDELPALSFFQSSLSPRQLLALKVFINTVGAAFLLVVAWYGYRYALRVGKAPIPSLIFLLGADKAPSMFWTYLALPVGFGLLAARMLVDAAIWCRMLATGATPPPPPASLHTPKPGAVS